MQNGWFGQLRPSGSMFPEPAWLKSINMTATATIYTQFGFAIAADGRQRWSDPENRDSVIRAAESDTAQKIFGLTVEWGSIAYLIRGGVAKADGSFDLAMELKTLVTPTEARGFAEPNSFFHMIAAKLEHYIEAARRDRRIEGYPTSFIDFIGYFNGDPFWEEIQFPYRFRNPHTNALHQVIPKYFTPGYCSVSGSMIIRDLIIKSHPTFSRFCQCADYQRSMEDAAQFVKGYIEACASPEALEFDPTCCELGGHIHVATVTPDNGFLWLPGFEPINP